MEQQIPRDGVFNFLKSSLVAQIMLEKKDVVTVKSIDSLTHALKLLQENKILSVPVQDGAVVGFLDELDIIYFAVENNDVTHTTCGSVMNHSHLNPYVTISKDVNLIKLCEAFCITHRDLHRAAVVNDNGEFTGIITQSKIIRYFAPHVKHFDFGNSTVEVLGIGKRPIAIVNENDTVSHTIQILFDKKLSAAAIVDSDGKLIGSFCASDLKQYGEKPSPGEMLKLTMKDYQSKVQHVDEYPAFVRKNTHCHVVVNKLNDLKIHRVYLVDKEQKPIGVINLSDIIELFWRHLLIE